MKREAKSVTSKREILNVACSLFRTKGFEATTMREIAEKAGMSLGASYYHFKNKEEITGISTDLARSLVRYSKISHFFVELSESFEAHFLLNKVTVINAVSREETAEVFAKELDKNLSSTILNLTEFLSLRGEVRKMQVEYMNSENTIREHLQSFEKRYKRQIALAKKEAGIN